MHSTTKLHLEIQDPASVAAPCLWQSLGVISHHIHQLKLPNFSLSSHRQPPPKLECRAAVSSQKSSPKDCPPILREPQNSGIQL